MTIEAIAKKIETAGGTLYRVGGSVRDELLGRKVHDEDFVVVGISKEKFIDLFKEAKVRGKSFQVFDLANKEFALARKEIKTEKGHTGFEIITGKGITIEEDLKRRDITINSIAKNVLTGEIMDPFNGQIDLKNKIIRATSKAFLEDPLRVYRVARFAATLNFRVDHKTMKMIENSREELQTLSKERVFEELKKALEQDKPSIFFEVLKEGKVLDIHFKEIYDLIGARQPEKYHPEGDSYNHTILALDNSAKLTKNLKLRFCALVHDIGKGRTPKEEYPHHYNHTQLGIEPLKELTKRIGIPKEWKESAKIAILEHMRGGNFEKMTISKKVSFLEKVNKSNLGLDGLQIIVYADRYRDVISEDIKGNTVNFAKIGKRMIKEIDGKYIEDKYKMKPCIEFGKKLHEERVKWMKENYS